MNLPDKSVSAEDVLHYAKTKHKGLPEHVKQAVVNGFMKRAVEFMKRAVDIDIGGAGRVSTNKLDNLQPNVQKYYKDHTATGNTGSKYLNTVNLSPTNIYGHQRSWLSNHPSTKYDVNTHPFIKDYPGNSVVVDMHGHGNRGGGQMFSPDQSTLIGNNEKYHINEQQLAKLTNPNAHNVFLESCNREGAMCGNTLSKVFPNATNFVHVPKNREGLFGNDYNDPKYFHSTNHPAFSQAFSHFVGQPLSAPINLNTNSPMLNEILFDNRLGLSFPRQFRGLGDYLSKPADPFVGAAPRDKKEYIDRVNTDLRAIGEDHANRYKYLWPDSAPPNVYRKVNNQWVSHGPYIAGKTNYIPQPEMNDYVHASAPPLSVLTPSNDYIGQVYDKMVNIMSRDPNSNPIERQILQKTRERNRSGILRQLQSADAEEIRKNIRRDVINNWRTNLHNNIFNLPSETQLGTPRQMSNKR